MIRAARLLTLVALALVVPATAQAELPLPDARSVQFERLDLGTQHACAIAGNGTVRCWGANNIGQLGYGNTNYIGDNEVPSSVGPVDIGPGRNAVKISVAYGHSCAVLDNGALRCWGANSQGQLGYGHTNSIGDDETPGSVGTVNLGAGRTAVQVATGGSHTCALLDNGTVRCWGLNFFGELGYGNTTTIGDNETPAAAGPVDLGAGRTAVAITAGLSHNCALLDNGTVRCWGANGSGQLGVPTGSVGDNETPGSVAPINFGAGRTAVAITAGRVHTCAILDDRTMRCWGNGLEGRLGYGNQNFVSNPATVGPVDIGAGRRAVAIAAGEVNSCALLDDGSLRCWGDGSWGRLGAGNEEYVGDNETPGTVPPIDLGEGRNAISISIGEYHMCALLDNGAIRCWGQAFNGQLGYGNTTPIGDNETAGEAGPVDLGPIEGAVETTTGANHSCALFANGSVRCWGANGSGQLGYGSTENIGDDENVGSPGPVDLGERSAVELAAGAEHTCALVDDGTVRCWGANGSGQLGHGSTEDVGDDELPIVVKPVNLGGLNALALTAGGDHTCAVLATGSVRCWGANGSGQLGYANTTTIGDDEDPGAAGPAVLGGSATAISAGTAHTCATLSDGTSRCWGSGTGGRLGYANTLSIGDNENPSLAGAVSLGRSAAGISAGGSHTCAPLDNGTVRCWGLAASGQLGYASTTDIGDNELPSAAGPVFLGRSGMTTTAGGSHTCALLDNGTIRCWGLAASGQLGYGNTTNIGDNELPGFVGTVDVGVRSSVDVSAGGSHTCALLDNGTVRCWGLNSSGQLGYGNTTNIGDNETPTAGGPVDFVDDLPVAVADSATVAEDSGATAIAVLVNDTDPDGGPKAIASAADPAHGTVNLTGGSPGAHTGLSYTPDAGYCGPDSFTYTLNGGSTATVSVTVTCVDDAPVAVADSATLAEDASATSVDVLANDTDVDGGPKAIGAKTNGAHGSVAILGGGIGLTYTPAPNYCGPDTFTYTLNGGSQATVSITVTCVDDLPVAVNDAATVAEDASAGPIDVLANDTDPDGGPKAIASASPADHGAISLTGGSPDAYTGISYEPESDYCGPDSFTYTLNGGSTATVSVTVTCVDDAPVAVNDSSTLVEDAGPTAIAVLANDTDIDNGPKTIASATDPDHGTVSLTGGSPGAHTGISYTSGPDYCGPDTFTYTLNGGSTGTVSIAVTCDNDSPDAFDDVATVAEDSSATAIDVLANDTDPDEGLKAIESKTEGGHGSVSVTGGGTGLTYQPSADYCGPDSFTYTLNGGSTATVSVTVTCVDDAPTAVTDSATVQEDAGATAIAVLANDPDSDGGPKSVQSAGDPAHGEVSITGGGAGLTYQPNPNYCGPDSFTYTLNGGSTATVSIAVTCVDDLPSAVGDSDTVLEDSPATAIDVLANDADFDGGPKTIVGKTNGAQGAVTVIGGGAGLTYQPNPNYCGPDSFTYTLNGGSTATVSIAVTCVEEPSSGPGASQPGSPGSVQSTFPTNTSSAPVVNITPGVGVVSGRRRPRIAIKGRYAFFTLTCRLAQKDCAGTVRIMATVPSVTLGPTMKQLTLVKGRFRIGPGRSVLVRAKLTKRGHKVLKVKRTLRGVASKMAIVDSGNGERGEIQVNLVRRPKASLLPTAKKK